MNKNWIWLAAGLVLGGGATAAILVSTQHAGKTPPAEEAATEAAPAEESAAAGHVKLTADQVKNAQIDVEEIASVKLADEIKLFGVIQEDPGAGFTVRSEAAGIVKAAEGRKWPDIGESLADGTVIGTLEPRVMPSDQIAIASQRTTLQTQVAAAQADVATAAASLDQARAAYERLRGLNTQDKNVSDRAVEEALARQKTEEAHLAGAKQTLDLAQKALSAVEMKLAPMPLVVTHGGEVIELPVHPGEAVESGQEILRVTGFDHVVAALDVPPGESLDATARQARIIPPSGSPLAGERLGTASFTDPKTRDQVVLFRAPADGRTLRPGTPVIGYVARSGNSLEGVSIPNSAIVRYQGKAWVYLAAREANEFDRFEVALVHPLPDASGWFISSGLAAGQKLVVKGAAILLSTELTPIGGGD